YGDRQGQERRDQRAVEERERTELVGNGIPFAPDDETPTELVHAEPRSAQHLRRHQGQNHQEEPGKCGRDPAERRITPMKRPPVPATRRVRCGSRRRLRGLGHDSISPKSIALRRVAALPSGRFFTPRTAIPSLDRSSRAGGSRSVGSPWPAMARSPDPRRTSARRGWPTTESEPAPHLCAPPWPPRTRADR